MNSSKLPTIIVADDHTLFSEALAKSLIAKQFNVAATAKNGKEVIGIIKKEQVDLVLMDISMPIMDGIETTEYLKKHHPKIKVLIISMYDKYAYIKLAVDARTDGYILKNSDPNELEYAIRTILSGNNYYSADVATVLTKIIRLQESSIFVKVSGFEKKLLGFLSDGYTSDEISKLMVTSVHTVNNYRKNLLIKFNARNISHLVSMSYKMGYIN